MTVTEAAALQIKNEKFMHLPVGALGWGWVEHNVMWTTESPSEDHFQIHL